MQIDHWIGLVRALGESLLEVLRAELAALQADLRRSGHYLWVGLALLGAAAGVLFWTLGLLLFAAVAVLAIWLPLWAAALVTAGLFAAIAGLLAGLGVSRLRRLESPVADVKRRIADHLEWWQHDLLAEPRLPAAPGAPIAPVAPKPGATGAASRPPLAPPSPPVGDEP